MATNGYLGDTTAKKLRNEKMFLYLFPQRPVPAKLNKRSSS